MAIIAMSDIADRIKELQSQVSGIVATYAFDAPNRLNSAELPAFINIPSEAEVDYSTSQMPTETRFWYMLLYVCSIQRPHEIAQRMSTVAQLIDNTYNVFKANPALGDLNFVLSAQVVGDSGITVMSYAGTSYSGVEFKLQVTTIANVVYE